MDTPPGLEIPARRTEQHLRSILDGFRSEWCAIDPLFDEVVDTVEGLTLGGGKRIRPAMAYWGHRGAGAQSDRAIDDLGAALELLQAFALFHDDVMDGSATRRRAPTAHVREAERHLESRWRGEPRRYGEAVAILAGDVCLVLADVLLADVPREVRALWNQLRVEVNLGQFLDVVSTVRGNASAATAELIVEYKTARYTIVRPLQMGAALAGRPDLAGELEAIGSPLGVAFQLRDDLLGALGDSSETGKPVGDDLREAKPTPLLLLARARSTGRQLAALDRVGVDMTDVDVEAVQQILHDSGAVAEIESRIDALTAEARTAVSSSSLTREARTELEHIARYLAGRST